MIRKGAGAVVETHRTNVSRTAGGRGGTFLDVKAEVCQMSLEE